MKELSAFSFQHSAFSIQHSAISQKSAGGQHSAVSNQLSVSVWPAALRLNADR
jgi:hypothetical protein